MKGKLLDKSLWRAPDIQKLAFVREEISIRKEVEQNTVEVEDKIRHEELDLDIQDAIDETKTL